MRHLCSQIAREEGLFVPLSFIPPACYSAQWNTKVCAISPHDSTGTTCLLWGQIVQTSPFLNDLLTKYTLQVLHVDPGSGAYSSSKLLGIGYVIQGCNNLVSPTSRPVSITHVCLQDSAQEVIVCAQEGIPESHNTPEPVKVKGHLPSLSK